MNIGITTNHIDESHPSFTVYISNLIKNLNLIDDNNYYLIHHSKMDLDIYRNNREIIVELPGFGAFGKMYWKYFGLPKEIKSLDLDLVHDTQGLGVFSVKGDYDFKKIVTIHDLSSLVFPSINYRGALANKLLGARTLRNADKIITYSESTKNDIIKFFGTPEEKIETIYIGKDDRFKVLDEDRIKNFKMEYHLNFPFILYLGVLQPRKNIPTLIRAFYKLVKLGTEHKLVIAGGKGWQYKEIFDIVKKLRLENEVIFTGHLPDDVLPQIYNAADLFVFPSLYEGFGLPTLEAMACGTPVITSNTSSLPEVVGDAGIMVDPNDVTKLFKAIKNVLTDHELRLRLSNNGLNRSKLFNWKKTAIETLGVYEKILYGG